MISKSQRKTNPKTARNMLTWSQIQDFDAARNILLKNMSNIYGLAVESLLLDSF
jgi:hypothetical protein